MRISVWSSDVCSSDLKVFGITAEFAEKYPRTTLALTKALIRAAMWLDENNDANRKEAVKILAKSEYVGADPEVIANSMTGTFEYEKGDKRPEIGSASCRERVCQYV